MSKETFDFSEALRRMKEGKKVRRNGCYFSLSINKYWHFFSLDDILATDWEEVEE